MDDENVANRLKLFMQELGINSSQFADTCGIARPNLSQFLTGRNKKVNNIFLSLVHKAYPDLSIDWLLFGEGNMMITNQISRSEDLFSDDNAVNNRKFSEFGNVSDSQNVELMSADSKDSEFLNYKGLNGGYNTIQRPSAQEINLNLKIHELEDKIEFLKKNPRKVTRITIYYDDSTFETFIPEDLEKN